MFEDAIRLLISRKGRVISILLTYTHLQMHVEGITRVTSHNETLKGIKFNQILFKLNAIKWILKFSGRWALLHEGGGTWPVPLTSHPPLTHHAVNGGRGHEWSTHRP